VVQYGVIYVGAKAVDALAQIAGITPVQAAQAIAIHELGHAYYQQRAYMIAPGDGASIDAKAEWCMQREGMASFYAFKVAQESGTHFVAGTTALPNLYDSMLQALNGIDPRSSMYEIAGIAAATQKFREDPKYVAFCKNPSNWNAPAYVTGDSGSDGGDGLEVGAAPEALVTSPNPEAIGRFQKTAVTVSPCLVMPNSSNSSRPI
jgi:hypothetical protein